jgi:glycosyltransferase involved in cell wall biosynthesis
MKVTICNGGGQADYLYGLVSGLHETPINHIDVLDIDRSKEIFDHFPKVHFHSVYRYQNKGSSFLKKGSNIIRYYFLQTKHFLGAKPRIVHFQWLNRFYIADRIFIPLIARLKGHKVVLTVHNVNAGKRDNNDTWYNRITLKILYRLCSHLIVHTPGSRDELIRDFHIIQSKISVVKHGMNNKVTVSGISDKKAREKFNIAADRKVILFFGNIDHYKGLDILIDSLPLLSEELKDKVSVIIAGNIKSPEYNKKITDLISKSPLKDKIIEFNRYISDEEIEFLFEAADCIALPYRDIYQSGVLFMAYNFGTPPVVTRVGNFENDIQHGKTGLISDEISARSLADSLEHFFSSSLYTNKNETRKYIKTWAKQNYSWSSIGQVTLGIYEKLLQNGK